MNLGFLFAREDANIPDILVKSFVCSVYFSENGPKSASWKDVFFSISEFLFDYRKEISLLKKIEIKRVSFSFLLRNVIPSERLVTVLSGNGVFCSLETFTLFVAPFFNGIEEFLNKNSVSFDVCTEDNYMEDEIQLKEFDEKEFTSPFSSTNIIPSHTVGRKLGFLNLDSYRSKSRCKIMVLKRFEVLKVGLENIRKTMKKLGLEVLLESKIDHPWFLNDKDFVVNIPNVNVVLEKNNGKK